MGNLICREFQRCSNNQASFASLSLRYDSDGAFRHPRYPTAHPHREWAKLVYVGLAEATDVELSTEDSKSLDVLIVNLGFFQMATADNVRGFDGDEWILEGVRKGKYHVAHRWCATSYDPERRGLTAFLAFVRFLLNKSRLSQLPPIKSRS